MKHTVVEWVVDRELYYLAYWGLCGLNHELLPSVEKPMNQLVYDRIGLFFMARLCGDSWGQVTSHTSKTQMVWLLGCLNVLAFGQLREGQT